MAIKILAFGNAAEITGKSSWEIPFTGNTDKIKELLFTEFPELRKINFTLAINKITVDGNQPIQDNDTVAILPPFSGG